MEKDIDSERISMRFFEALGRLREEGRCRSVAEWARRYGISARLMGFQKQDPGRNIIRTAWLYYLVRDWGVNARWLLTGEGPMLESDENAQKRAETVREIDRLLAQLL